METQTQKTPMRDVLLRAVAVLGLIAVLLLGAWGIIQLAVAIPTLFSNIGNGSFSFFTPSAQKETLVVSSAATVSSGQTLQVSWTHKNKDGEYSYSISYACQSGLSIKVPLPTGSYQPIACNTPFNFVNANDRMTVIPTATGKTLPLALTVSATKLSSGAVTAQGTATTNVAPAAAATIAKPVATTPSNNTVYTTAPVRQALYGYGDLMVRINSVTPTQSGLTVVTFTITNVGTNSIAGGWVFNANLPINGSYLFTSQPQRALFPGDKIVYTLSYSNPNGYNSDYGNSYLYGSSYVNGYVYSGPVTITVDPQNYALESNEYNNTAYTAGY